jgi:spore germination cell wall hydrolase CwlJ-like protein
MIAISQTHGSQILSKWLARAAIIVLMLTSFLSWSNPCEEDTEPVSGITDQVKRAIKPLELQCLAENIYHEAGNQPELGKVAVGIVTINRTLDSRFPKSVCGVVNQSIESEDGPRCQFSLWCNPNRVIDVRSKNWKESLKVAKKILDGSIPTFDLGLQNILYFHLASVNPKWKLNKVAQIGDHIFYSDIKH